MITKENIISWLTACDREFEFLKYGFADTTNFKSGYFEDSGLKIDLHEFYYYQNIAVILNKYFVWIPDDRSWASVIVEDEQNEELPF